MRQVTIYFLLFLPIVFLSCSEDDAAQSQSVPFTKQVAISIEGTTITNTEIAAGMGPSTLYRAYPSAIVPGLSVWVESRGPMMMGGRRYQMYDDGTHGDRVRGDGEYCYEDFDQMRLHMNNAMPGHYTFEFYCTDASSNHGMHTNAWVDIR